MPAHEGRGYAGLKDAREGKVADGDDCSRGDAGARLKPSSSPPEIVSYPRLVLRRFSLSLPDH